MEKKSFLHRIVTDHEQLIYFENLKRKKPWFYLAKHQHRRHGQIAPKRRLCSETRKKLCNMIYWNYSKQLMGITSGNNWITWTMHCSKNVRMVHEIRTSDTALRQCFVPPPFHRPGHNQNTEMKYATTPVLFTRLGPFRLFLRSMVNGLTRLHLTKLEEVQNLLDKWFRSKTRILSSRYSWIAREMAKMCI